MVRKPIDSVKFQKYLKEITSLKEGFDLLNDHVIITDKNANILYANKAVEKNTGFSVEEVLGKNPGDLWGSEMPRDFYEKMWRRIKTQKQPFVSEVKNKRKDGKEYWQELHITPILDKAGGVKFFIGIEPNITERKIKDKFREEFISLTAHQLKNPLAIIRWTTDWLLSRGSLSSSQKKMLEKIYSEDKYLIDLISDLLLLSRLEDGERKEKIDLAQIVEDVLEAIRRQFPKITFSATLPRYSLFIEVPRIFATQIFHNLVLNAAEYSKKDGGKVALSLKKEKDSIVFSCADNGIGIPKKDQAKIFSRFFRASNAAKSKEGGSGLGLFIVKMIAENLGWKVFFESEESKGTAFYVRVPV